MAILLAQSSIGWNQGKDQQQPNHPHRLEDIIPAIAAMGYDGIEINSSHLDGRSDDELRSLRDLLERHHLRVPLISPYFNFTKNSERAAESLSKAEQALHQAELLGAEGIRTFTGGDRSADASPEQWQRCVAILQELCDRSQQAHIHWCLHTHDWNLVDTVAGCRRLRQLVQRDNLTILYKPSYFMPHEHWSLHQLLTWTKVVQVTATGNSGDIFLSDTTIDYRGLMQTCLQQTQPMWFSFTHMGLNAQQQGEQAAQALRQWRDEVLSDQA